MKWHRRELRFEKVLSDSSRAGRLRLMGKYIGHRLENRTIPFGLIVLSPKGIVHFWSCSKAVAYVFPHKAELSSQPEPDNTFWTASTRSSTEIKHK